MMVVINRETCVVARCVHNISWIIIDKRRRRVIWPNSNVAKLYITSPGMTQLAMESDTGANAFYSEVDVGCSELRIYLAGVYAVPSSHISFCLWSRACSDIPMLGLKTARSDRWGER